MAENDNSAATSTQVQPSKLGKMERVEMTFPNETNQINPPQNGVDNNVTEGANATNKANEGGAPNDSNTNGTPPAPTLTDDQLKEYFKSVGIDYDGIDSLKQKLTPKAEETPEQKAEKDKAVEKRRLDLFISGGGTAEQYVSIKNVAEMDIAELSKNTLKAELKTAGFDDAQIEQIIKDRYYQIEDEEIEQEEDESDKAYKKRLKEHFATKLANRSSYIQKQASGVLAGLNDVINSEDLRVQNELTISTNIDEQFKTLQREDTYEIGEINGKPIPPVKSQVPEVEIAAVRDMLKDPEKRNNLLLNKDGGLNLTNIANILTENAKLKAALKVSYHEGSTRTNAHWQATFGSSNPHEIGVGGSQAKPNGQKSQPASVGKVQRVQPTRQ